MLLAAGMAIAAGLGSSGPGGASGEPRPQVALGSLSRTAFVLSQHRPRAVVWAVGDGADGGVRGRQVAALAAAGRPDRLLYLGDVYETGSASDFAGHYAPTYGRLATRTAPTPGNHDWPRHREGYDPYWRRALGHPAPAYYAFRTGGWEILGLNSEIAHGARSPQVRWLRRELGRGRGTCRLAFWHRPRYSGGTHGDEPDVQPFWDALRGHATIIANGHEHDMQRFRPRGGLIQLIAGAGGHGRYPVRRHAGPAFADARHYGAVRLDLSPGVARWTFVAVGGRVLDRGRVACG